MVNGSVESCFDFRTKTRLEGFLDGIGLAIVDEVVHIKPEVEGRMSWKDGAIEDAGGMGTRAKAQGDEDGSCLFIPMAWRAFESVESLEEAKVSVRLGEWTTRRSSNNIWFIFRKGALDEGLGYVCLLWSAVFGCCDGQQGTKLKLGEDGGKTVTFGPIVWVQVAKDDEAVLATDGVAILILLEGGDGHCG